jgi:hypothetical protein
MMGQSYDVSGGEQYDRFDIYANYGPNGRDSIAIVQLGPSNALAAGKVVDAESHAIRPDGRQVGISTEPYHFDTRPDRQDPRVPNIRTALFLLDANGQRDVNAWQSGDWKFILALDTPNGRQTREFSVALRRKLDVWWIWMAPN